MPRGSAAAGRRVSLTEISDSGASWPSEGPRRCDKLHIECTGQCSSSRYIGCISLARALVIAQVFAPSAAFGMSIRSANPEYRLMGAHVVDH